LFVLRAQTGVVSGSRSESTGAIDVLRMTGAELGIELPACRQDERDPEDPAPDETSEK
jgi:hypothetical protein